MRYRFTTLEYVACLLTTDKACCHLASVVTVSGHCYITTIFGPRHVLSASVNSNIYTVNLNVPKA